MAKCGQEVCLIRGDKIIIRQGRRIMKRHFRLTVCKQHEKNDHADAPDFCWSCQASIQYNVMHEVCECGNPATGYSVTQAGSEFYCDEHFQVL